MIEKGIQFCIQMIVKAMFIAIGIVICMPVWFMISGSVMGNSDLK